MKEYLTLVRHVLDRGTPRDTRSGSTLSVFGVRCEYDCSSSFPLVTTKRVSWKNVLRELLWFLRCGTTTDGVGSAIWDGNATRGFLDARGLTHYEEGELGPIYGYQWRNFGGRYPDKSGGVDQIQQCVDLLRTNPTSRRILWTAWNPVDVPSMALPPCHVMGQFYCRGDVLDLQFYQRSADIALGVPYNIASYAMLLYMMAHVTGKRPGTLIHVIGDAHIYTEHVEGLREQCSRIPKERPTFHITRTVTNMDDFKEEDFKMEGYTHGGSLTYVFKP